MRLKKSKTPWAPRLSPVANEAQATDDCAGLVLGST